MASTAATNVQACHRKDLIGLSPEAQALYRHVDVADVFADHATVTVGFEMTTHVEPFYKWIVPSKIP